MSQEIIITDEFTNSLGKFPNYHTYDSADQIDIDNQSHVDIRNFTASENWTAGALGTLSDHNHFQAITLTLATGMNTTESVDQPVDISGLAPTDVISIGLPSFSSSITKTTSYVDFTSHPTGDFTAGPTDTVAFSASATPITTGDQEFSFPISSLATIDRSKITGVRFRIDATGAASFKALGIRALASTWQLSNIDINTKSGRLIRPPAKDASAASPAFEFPTVYRSAIPSSILADPRPIDGRIAVMFNPGSRTATQNIDIFMREVPWDIMTQIELDALTQDDLDNFHTDINLDGSDTDILADWRQPEVDQATYRSRTQSELDGLTQDQLDGLTQEELERVVDDTSESFIRFGLEFTPTATNVVMQDQDGNGYSSAQAALTPGKTYLWVVSLHGHTARGTLYALSSLDGLTQDELDGMTQTEIEALNLGTEVLDPAIIFDTGDYTDSTHFLRRKGRVGWQINLEDGDAFVESIRTQSLVFAEILTRPMRSYTPVDGAQLFVPQSPPVEMFTGFSVTSYTPGMIVTRDTSRSTTGESWRVIDYGTDPDGGILSNWITFTNFEHAEISFDVFYPSSGPGLEIYLLSAGGLKVPLNTPRIIPDQWYHVRIPTRFAHEIQTGTYRLVIISAETGAATWWVDNVSIHEPTIVWEGKAEDNDPFAPEFPRPYQQGENMVADPQALNASLWFHNSTTLSGGVWSTTGAVSRNLQNDRSVQPIPLYFGNYHFRVDLTINSSTATGVALQYALYADNGSIATSGMLDSLDTPPTGPLTLEGDVYIPPEWRISMAPVGHVLSDVGIAIVTNNNFNITVNNIEVSYSDRDPYQIWTPFRDVYNIDNGGVLFAQRGRELQVRGTALRQSATINGPIKIIPRYASLGRLVGTR